MPAGYAADPDYQRALQERRRRQQQTQRNNSANWSGMGGQNMSPTYGAPGTVTPGIQNTINQLPGFQNATTNQQAWALRAMYDANAQGGQMPQWPAQPSGTSSRGGYGGGGGGGGGPAGLDQATLDWLFGQIGRGRPQNLTANPLDLPDPSQYMTWDPSQYGIARQGVQTGIEGIRNRGNTAFNAAQAELNQYQNPYGAGLQTRNPDQYAAMERMARANEATGALGQVAGEGVQADQAMANAFALMAANDQARQAANLRALGGDRRTMEQNLGIEGNMLNLGVNMAEARGKTAFDQRLQDAMLQAAQQEAMQNWTRGNTVADTNVSNANAWNSGLLQTLMSIIGARAPGTALPADVGGFYAPA